MGLLGWTLDRDDVRPRCAVRHSGAAPAGPTAGWPPPDHGGPRQGAGVSAGVDTGTDTGLGTGVDSDVSTEVRRRCCSR